ncbi:MAG TPA: TolC family protein [Gemmatimonadales bacterium]|jgi:outer membrane protein TolC|nr:TolC family protein [Gemmatimonadales bacterium]
MALPQITLIAALISAAQTPTSPTPVRLSFADAIRRVTSDNAPPSVELAGLRTDESRARVTQARSGLLPSVSVGGLWSNRTLNPKSLGFSFPGLPSLIGPFDVVDGRVYLQQTVFDFSKLKRVNAAKTQLSASTAEGSATEETAAQAVAVAYARAARALAVVGARRADSALAAELVTVANAQVQAGVSASIDVTRARVQLSESAGRLILATAQLERAKIDLARSLGLATDAAIELTDTLSLAMGAANVPLSRDSAVAQAIAVRPDLAAELARGNAARTAASAISAERLPRLDLAADYGVTGNTAPKSIATHTVGVQVTWPILDGLRREGRLAEQKAVAQQSDVRAKDLRQQVAADVDAALLDLRSAASQLTISGERLRLAADEVSQARQRFEAGVAGNIEVINAQESLVRAREADIDARFAGLTAKIALARSVGSARTLH